MNVHHYSSRAAAAIAAAVLLVCTSTPAQAATIAKAASASVTVGSGTWGAVATQRTAAPYGTGPLPIPFTNNGNPAHPSFTPQYFTVGNTGTLPITKANYTGTASAPTTVQFIVESCSTTWNETSGTCPGTTKQVLAPPSGSSSTVTTTAVPVNPSTQIRLRVRVSTSGNVPISPKPTLTITISVDRTQVRAATTSGG